MARPSGPHGTYAKTPKRREEILAAAFDVFSRVGYTNSSLSEIAKQAGLTMPGLRHHFASKEILLEAVLNERDLDANVHLEGRAGVDLMRGLVEIAARDDQDTGLTQLFTILSAEGTNPEHPAHPYFLERYGFILRNVERALREAYNDGHLRPNVDPKGAAMMYVALSDGFALQRLYGVATWSQAELLARFFNNLLGPEVEPIP